MTLMPLRSSPLDDVWVALDLETTGLNPAGDEIIEVGAVKFQGRSVLDTFQAFVNPNRPLTDFIKKLTGIAQADVDHARPFSAIGGALAAFVGPNPIIGHNLGFDLGFLGAKGLRLSNPRCDTWDIAYVLYPRLRGYSLAELSRQLRISRDRPHRAVHDAEATKDVFVELVEALSELDPFTLAEIHRLASRSSWSLAYLVGKLQPQGTGPPAGRGTAPGAAVRDGTARLPAAMTPGESEPRGEVRAAGPPALDERALARRLQHGRSLRPNRHTVPLDVDFVASLIEQGGPLSNAMPGFEIRLEQVAMAREVARAINEGNRLVVEAGTGVGKSLAYLVPAALHALVNHRRVVVSTNTINLQDQLLTKDVPVLLNALAEVSGVAAEEFRFTQLKGRANYLCLRRWSHLNDSESLSENDARFLAKTLVWLQTTDSGDRSELNLGHRLAGAPWDRLSAQGATECPRGDGPCFLRAAREKAASSHLVIVNHALLLSDMAAGGSVLPDYDVLIIDEAHHLEEEATRHLGFELMQASFDEHLQSVAGDRGLLNEAGTALRGSSAAATRRQTVEEIASGATSLFPRVRDHVAGLFADLGAALEGQGDRGRERSEDARVTSATRAQPGWSQIEIRWENVDLSLAEAGNTLTRLQTSLEGLEDAGLANYEGLMARLADAHEANAGLRRMLAEFVPQPEAGGIYWVTRTVPSGELALHAAPLHVGDILNKQLFSQKDCVVMTSATLSARGTFDHVRERTGFDEAQELMLGSPFDYGKAALLYVPDDIPEPNSPAYPPAVGQAIMDAALAAGGRTMALFTSHASLRATAAGIRGKLDAQGISVLAQGVDGTPPRLVRRFLEDPRSVLLGTSSFWEGVDLAGESLKVLLVARLPFNVPSEPVFATRSELYEDPFNEFSVPQAILRLRQGFGRLIRTKSDRGVAVILDRRITSRRYGKAFVESLPPVSIERGSLVNLADAVRKWVG